MFFILNKTVLPQQSIKPFKKNWANATTLVLKIIAIIAGLSITIYNNLESKALYGDTAPKQPLYGIYEVEDFIINNDTLPPVLTDTVRWRYLVFEKDNANIFNMKSSNHYDFKFFRNKTDTLKHNITFINYADSLKTGNLHYQKTDSIHYTFKGIFNEDTLELHTVRTDQKNYQLMNRGFHWVSEYPYNR